MKLDEILNGEQSDNMKIAALQQFVEQRLYFIDENNVAFDIPLVQAYNALANTAAKKFQANGGFKEYNETQGNLYSILTEANFEGAKHLEEIKYIQDNFHVNEYNDDSLEPETPIKLDYENLRQDMLKIATDWHCRGDHYILGATKVDLPYNPASHGFYIDKEGRGMVFSKNEEGLKPLHEKFVVKDKKRA